MAENQQGASRTHPLDVSCSKCGAEKHDPCRSLRPRRYPDGTVYEFTARPHRERAVTAAWRP